jgi:hypothetical protein
LKNLSPSQISLVFNLQKLVDALERKAILWRQVHGAALQLENHHTLMPLLNLPYTTLLTIHLLELVGPSLHHLDVHLLFINLSVLSLAPETSLGMIVTSTSYTSLRE